MCDNKANINENDVNNDSEQNCQTIQKKRNSTLFFSTFLVTIQRIFLGLWDNRIKHQISEMMEAILVSLYHQHLCIYCTMLDQNMYYIHVAYIYLCVLCIVSVDPSIDKQCPVRY